MKQNIALGSSVIAIVISIIAICVANPSKPELGLDYQGILIGILSLLTTVLLAFVGGSYFFQSRVIDKKIKEMSNGNKYAIAENMFYNGYSGMMTSGVYYEQFITSLKTAIAAIIMHFSEEKTELLCEIIKERFNLYEGWESKIIEELEKVKYKSLAISECIKLLQNKKV